MIKASISVALGTKIDGIEQKKYNGHWAEVILHSNSTGIFNELKIDDNIFVEVVEKDLWVRRVIK